MSTNYSSIGVWGPHFAFVLKCVAYNHVSNPDHLRTQHIANFFNSLVYLLPDNGCKREYSRYIITKPVHNALRNSNDLIAWVSSIFGSINNYIKSVPVTSQQEETEFTVPARWGPHFWYVMRCVAHNFPDDITRNQEYGHQLKLFYYSLQLLLPCVTCQGNYRTHLRMYPIDSYMKSKESIIKWVELIYDETVKVSKQDKTVPVSDNKKESNKGIDYNVTFTRNCPNCNKNR